jgi:hypothetical protein
VINTDPWSEVEPASIPCKLEVEQVGMFSKQRSIVGSTPEFARTILHQTLFREVYIQSQGWLTFQVIHEEVNGKTLIKLFYKEGTFEFVAKTASDGYRAMTILKDDFKSFAELFPDANVPAATAEDAASWLQYPSWNRIRFEGFSNPILDHGVQTAIKMLQGQADWPNKDSLDPLSRGNLLSQLFDDSTYFPSTAAEIDFIWDYLATLEISAWGQRSPNSNFTIGYFGNFKYVLKSLTRRFENLIETNADNDQISSMAGCLGSGYGQVDAYLSKGYLMPLDVVGQGYHYNNKFFSKLEEFGGRAYPSLATAQYLARKGTRLLRLIQDNCEPMVVTRFKVNALNAADVLDENSSKFSHYQILVNKIVFGEVSESLVSGRKVAQESLTNADFEVLGKNFISGLRSEELSIIKNWVESLAGNNPTITKLAFELSQEVGASFPLNMNTIKFLSLSNSSRAKTELSTFITANPDKFTWLPESTWPNFIKDLSDETIKEIFDQNPYQRSELFSQWANYTISKNLNQREIEISRLFLAEGLFYSNSLLVSQFLVKLAQTTQFEPFDKWEALASLRSRIWVSTEDLLRFLGAEADVPGIFNVLHNPNIKLSEIYAQDLATTLQWDDAWSWGAAENQTKVNDSLGKLLNSQIENLRLVAVLVISRKLISQTQINNFFAVLNDPKVMYEILKEAVSADDVKSVLVLLSVLAQEEKQVFWRLFATESQQMFESWQAFPKFLWQNIDQLPRYLVEVFKNYGWLEERVIKETTPSSVAKLNRSQAEFFVEALKNNPQFLQDKALVKALLIAPDSDINLFGCAFVKQNSLFPDFWLLMLESNLPLTSKAAVAYLESQHNSKDFEEQLMKALDSNNGFARSAALKILNSANSPKLLADVVQKLAENRNKDTWGVVASNMNLINEAKHLKTFTRRVFLSRRKARAQKEQVKNKITTLVRDLTEVVERDILVRMSLGSVAKDRDWALRQIAQSGLDLEDVKVEFSWKAGADV